MTPREILANHKLKRTSFREGIIGTILKASCPLSEEEIRQEIAGHYDRTTFYRAFKMLESKGIIHKIIVDNGVVKYALNNSITNKSDHAHFYCTICSTAECLETVALEKPDLPDGYKLEGVEFIIKGICNQCSNNKSD